MQGVQKSIEEEVQPLSLSAAMIVDLIWRDSPYRIVGQQGIFRSSPLTEYAHQQIVTDDGHVFQVHDKRGDCWALVAIRDNLVQYEDTDDFASRAA
jgi:hypothetical protein